MFEKKNDPANLNMTKFEAIHSGNHFIKHNKPLISEECASLPMPQQLW